MRILDQKQIKQKIKRLAIQIIEHNYGESEIILAGINNNGYGFAKLLATQLRRASDIKFTLAHLNLNPANPIAEEVTISMDRDQLKDKVVIIVDDVANTGRTIFYAFKPFLEMITKKIEVAVLVDRKHKSFPIKVDYVGLTLSTTIQNNISVKIINVEELEAHLE